METVFHTYNFDLSSPEQKQGWAELKEKLSGHPHCMNALGNYYFPTMNGCAVTLQTEHLFNNQWNALWPDRMPVRLFDWALEANLYTDKIKCGHYLDQTDEMKAIRRETLKCGYCGKQEPSTSGLIFCTHCIDSEYLKSSDLFMTRLIPVADEAMSRPPLSETERERLMPIYREAQLHGITEKGKARLAKQRIELNHEWELAVGHATDKRDGFLWLMDHGIKTDNVIFYNHTGRFGFGWRKPFEQELLDDLLNVISEFRWPYDIQTADGRKLSGN